MDSPSKVPSREEVLAILQEVKDPEIPVISVVEMGIVRDIRWDVESATLHVQITPTYSGCPAMKMIEQEVAEALQRSGYSRVVVDLVFAPAWTTDWMGPEAREKLRKYGIAPPGALSDSLIAIGAKRASVECPFCRARDTELRSEFGSTACKSFFYCKACLQPFEHFKPI